MDSQRAVGLFTKDRPTRKRFRCFIVTGCNPNRQLDCLRRRWESNPHVRHGKAVGYRYIMGAKNPDRIVKEPEHRVGLEPT